MGAFVLAGARQEIGDHEPGKEPGRERDLEHARHAARHEGERDRGKHDQAAEQPRRNEGAVTACRQRLPAAHQPRRRMQQGSEMIANWRNRPTFPAHACGETRSPY